MKKQRSLEGLPLFDHIKKQEAEQKEKIIKVETPSGTITHTVEEGGTRESWEGLYPADEDDNPWKRNK